MRTASQRGSGALPEGGTQRVLQQQASDFNISVATTGVGRLPGWLLACEEARRCGGDGVDMLAERLGSNQGASAFAVGVGRRFPGEEGEE
jgi:hypothetical protein